MRAARFRMGLPGAGTCLVLACLLSALPASPVSAQVRGTVVDASRGPVPGAILELWRDGQRAAGTQSHAQGAFAFPPAPQGGPVTLTVRRVGFRTRTIDLSSRDTILEVRMEAQPIVLAPLVVASPERLVCPNREDPRARWLWERMRTRYWQEGMDTVPVFAFVEFREGIGARDDADSLRTSAGWTDAVVSTASARYLPRTGYATAISSSLGERHAHWQYRTLDDGAKQDFTHPFFGAQHTFSLIHQEPERAVIAFCPREGLGRNGQILGTLVLGSDTTLREARWSFRTQEPREDAGGEAAYYPPDRRFGNALLAQETAFWRKTTGARYYMENRTYTGWRVREADGAASDPRRP